MLWMFGYIVIGRFLVRQKFSTDVINNTVKTNSINDMNYLYCSYYLYCLFRSAGFYFLDGLDFTDKFDIRHLIEC